MESRFKYLAIAMATAGLLAIPAVASANPGEEEMEIDAPLKSGPQEEIEYPAGLGADEYFALPEAEQLRLKEANSSLEDMAAAAELMSPTATPFMDQVRAVGVDVEATFEKFPDVHTRYEVDADAGTFSIRYFNGADPARQAEYISTVKQAMGEAAATLSIEPAGYLLSANEAVLAQIVSREGEWAERIQGGEIVGAPDPLGDGVVRVGIQGEVAPEWTSFEVDGVPVEITTSKDPLIALESRWVDYSPYSPGGRLNNSAGAFKCTTGFGWRRWSDNKLMGSTAAHCATGIGGVNSFYNAGNLVGSRSVVSTTRDSMSLTPGGSIAPNVFVGPVGTSTIFPLKGASVLPVGSPIAFSGAKTGSHVSSVAATGLSLSYQAKANNGTWYAITGLTGTWSQSTDGGDSGGPWITSNGSNQAFAHGSHTGKTTIPGVGVYSSFMDINKVSAALQATIYIQ